MVSESNAQSREARHFPQRPSTIARRRVSAVVARSPSYETRAQRTIQWNHPFTRRFGAESGVHCTVVMLAPGDTGAKTNAATQQHGFGRLLLATAAMRCAGWDQGDFQGTTESVETATMVFGLTAAGQLHPNGAYHAGSHPACEGAGLVPQTFEY
eukprot:scaffold242178_cov36-Tisochrysis_lutea.AAC.2